MTPEAKTTCETSEQSCRHLKAAANKTYSSLKENPVENTKITQFLPMVHKIVQKVVIYLKPPLTYEDLVSAGIFGLVKAAQDYDASKQTEFKTYAYIRIRGAILDELRNWSFVPENVTKQISEAAQISYEITNNTGSMPSDEELAGKLQMSVDKLYQMFEMARAKNFVSFDSPKGDLPSLSQSFLAPNSRTPDEQLEHSELVEQLVKAIQNLDKKQKQVIILYYQQQLTMKQIAEVFNITEPRVSQLHAKALFNLSIKLKDWKNAR